MSETMDETLDFESLVGNGNGSLTEEEKREIEQNMSRFLEDRKLFEGHDPEIVEKHTMEARTELEERSLEAVREDEVTRMVVENRLQAIVNEAQDMEMHIACSPGAKWGDLITGLYTAEGDMAVAATGGVLLFLPLTALPIKHVLKRWREKEDYEISEGDVFHHNDTRFGNVHNADVGTFVPIFYEGELIAWAGCNIHEGENGSTEPGGIPTDSESIYDEGLKIPPMKIGTDYEVDEEMMELFLNHVRDRVLINSDQSARLAGVKRIAERVQEVCEEYSIEAVVGGMRHTMETTAEKTRNRIEGIPNGTYRHTIFPDNTLKDDCLIKLPMEVEVRDRSVTINVEGTAAEFMDRPINCIIAAAKGQYLQYLLNYLWPDLPRNQAVFEPFEVKAHKPSAIHCGPNVPNAQCMQLFLISFDLIENIFSKATYGDYILNNESGATVPHANHFPIPHAWVYGGFTQHGEFAGNMLTDLNTEPSGGRYNRDGLHSHTGIFSAMADMGETEMYEEEWPLMAISRTRLVKDLEGFGKYRGGHGHHQYYTHKDTFAWSWMATGIGSRFPVTMGIFGGYSCPSLPVGWVKDVNIFEEMKDNPENLEYDVAELMQKKPFEGGEYGTWDNSLQQTFADEGEIFWMTQGAGGGLGDPLTRDPEKVVEEMNQNLVSEWVADNIYYVAYAQEADGEYVLQPEETEERRRQEREDRLARGTPFEEFVEDWTREDPPEHIPYFGSWDDKDVIYGGTPEDKMNSDELHPISMNDFREEHPELFDTPVYPETPQWQGDLESFRRGDGDGTGEEG